MLPRGDAVRMARGPAHTPFDWDTLAEFLDALSYPLRLELLHVLRFPHTLSEIKVAPHRVEAGGNPERPAAKQTVVGHREKLVDAGLVRTAQVERGGKSVPVYEVNPQRLYGLTEDLRRLSVIYAGHGRADDQTGTLGAAPARAERLRGPRVVLVHGVYEGKAYRLDPRTRGPDGWVIGRKADAAVSLDYDPYVSLQNSTIEERGREHVITDLEESKNGTLVNWEPMPRGSSRELESGDVIGVGRSLLLFLGT